MKRHVKLKIGGVAWTVFLLLSSVVIARSQDLPQPGPLTPEYYQAKVFTLTQELNQAYGLIRDFQKQLDDVKKERDELKKKLKEYTDEK